MLCFKQPMDKFRDWGSFLFLLESPGSGNMLHLWLRDGESRSPSAAPGAAGPLPKCTQRSLHSFGLGLQDRCFLSLLRKCDNALCDSRKCSFGEFLRKGGRRERRTRGARCECRRDPAGLRWGRCGRQGRIMLPGSAAARSRESRAGNGSRPPPSGTKAPRDGKHTPIMRETGLFPLCQQEWGGTGRCPRSPLERVRGA